MKSWLPRLGDPVGTWSGRQVAPHLAEAKVTRDERVTRLIRDLLFTDDPERTLKMALELEAAEERYLVAAFILTVLEFKGEGGNGCFTLPDGDCVGPRCKVHGPS